jgi:hypothetical protein
MHLSVSRYYHESLLARTPVFMTLPVDPAASVNATKNSQILTANAVK